MNNEKGNFQFHPMRSQKQVTPGPDIPKQPAGTRQEFTFSIPDGGPVLDEIMGTWQGDGTVILDRTVDPKKVFQAIFGGRTISLFELQNQMRREEQVEEEQKPEPQAEQESDARTKQQPTSDDDYKERMERQKQWEIKHYGKEVARRKSSAQWRAEKGEDAVPYRYYKAVNRVLVRKDALGRDFNKTYDYVCDVLGSNPVIAIDEDEFIHFARKK